MDEKTLKDNPIRFIRHGDGDPVKSYPYNLVTRMCWNMGWNLELKITGKYFSKITPDKKDYYPFAFAVGQGDDGRVDAPGCDGVTAYNIGGYKMVFLCNIYDGFRKKEHFHCGHDVERTPYMILTLKAIGGLDINALTEAEKEAAAQGLENGFLKKENDIISPKILVIETKDEKAFYELANDFAPEVSDFAETLCDDFYALVKKFLPRHLYGQAGKFINHTCVGFGSDVIERCIRRGILYRPEKLVCAEGTYMGVEK